ncbi:MAG: transglycosylase domain-containing protein [Mycobacteriales bacterium]
MAVSSFTVGLVSEPVTFTEPAPPKAALLYDMSGRYFATIRSPEVRETVPSGDIPQVMRNAIVAAEDERFLEHGGVDPLAVVRAAYRDIFNNSRQGGSTITQQYVKNVYVGRDRTLMRKLREAGLAVKLEQQLSKDEILTRYLNGLYLGNGTYGVQAASKYYFGFPVTDVRFSLSQATLLAGIAPAPSSWNPVRNFAKAKERQLYTLNRMVALGLITPGEASRAFRQPSSRKQIVERTVADPPTEAPEFAGMAAAALKRTPEQGGVGEDELFRGGLRVKTTLDLLLQKATRAAIREVLDEPDDPDVAVVALDPRSGELRAIVSKNYRRAGFNLATQAKRSTGSAIKPFTLLAALEAGKSVDDVYYGPPCLRVTAKYNPCNAEKSERGFFTLRKAMEQSVNTVYMKLALDITRERIKRVAVAAGLAPPENFHPAFPSMALGVEVTPLSLARGYATIANHGVRNDVRLLREIRATDDTGSTFTGDLTTTQPPPPKPVRVVPQRIADEVADVLRGVVERGTGRAARQDFPVFGKTGTTNDYTNAWFIGCTEARDLCIATWMGYRRGDVSMRGVHGVRAVYGGTFPAQIFSAIWRHYDALKAAERAALTGVPVPTRSPTPRRTRSPRPRRASLSPTPSEQPSPTPSVEPSQTDINPFPQPSESETSPGPLRAPP